MKITSKTVAALVRSGRQFVMSVASPISTKDQQAQTGKLGNEFDYYSDDT